MREKAPGIPFVKASACGNDFLLIELSAIEDLLSLRDLAALTRRICDRHDGVGADGVEWMLPHAKADVEIRLINADGSAAEISGNGTRCVAAYLCAERGQEKINIQTGAGLKVCTLVARSDSGFEFETAMGESKVGEELTVATSFGDVRGIPVSMGNPHYVVFVPHFHDEWVKQAEEIQCASGFEHGVNVELVMVGSKHVETNHDVQVRFFEPRR